MTATSILCVTTDAAVIASFRRLVAELGAEFHVARSLPEAATTMATRSYDVVLVQVDTPGNQIVDGLRGDLLSAGQPPVIAMSRNGSIRDAVRAIRAGACDYLSVPSEDIRAVGDVLRSALHGSDKAIPPVQERCADLCPFEGFITVDHRTLRACETLARVSDSSTVVLIEGESGTGKALLARKLHERSGRRDRPFVEVNCSILTESQIEGEFFGRSPGPPGPQRQQEQRGRFELANEGTLLVKGIEWTAVPLLVRILRAAESPNTRPARGGVRLVLAVNPALEDGRLSRAFADDAARDVGSVRVGIPSLRERIVDIPPLAHHFVQFFSAKHGRGIEGVSAEAMSTLVHYKWPGNVRELENAVEYAVILSRGGIIGVEGLPQSVTTPLASRAAQQSTVVPLKAALREPERRHILRALRSSHWNKHHAARKLQISRSTLYKKMREHGLEGRPVLHGSTRSD